MDKKPILLEDLNFEQWPNLILWAVPKSCFHSRLYRWGISWYQKRMPYDTKGLSLLASTIGNSQLQVSSATD